MKARYLGWKLLCVVGFAIGLSACGPRGGSIAFKTVDSGVTAGGPQPQTQLPSTLMDAVIQQGVPKNVASVAFAKYDQFSSYVKNTRYMTIIDFTQNSGVDRLYMINMNSGHVDKLPVAHGLNSDPNDTGYATEFSNTPNSLQSSLGTYIVAEKFMSSEHGYALRLDGLESTNSMARPRGIIMHSATYVQEGRAKQGRSWGCPAVPLDWISQAIDRLRDGSFLYAYGVSKTPMMSEEQIREMVTTPGYQWLDESAAPVGGE